MKISLRPISLDDGKTIVKWRNSYNVIRHCFNKNTITEEINEKFYNEYVVSGKYKQFIVERMDEDYGAFSYDIATVYLKDIDNYNKRCELCIFTSDDEEWNDEAKSQAIRMLLEKAFNEYDIHKVYSYVFSEFLDEAELLKKAGFKAETILCEESKDIHGKYIDVIRFSVFKDVFKYKTCDT